MMGATYDGMFMGLVGFVELIFSFLFLIEVVELRDGIDTATKDAWRQRVMDGIHGAYAIGWTSVAILILTAIYFGNYAKRTTEAVRDAKHGCPGSRSTGWCSDGERQVSGFWLQLGAITLFAAVYFADFLLLGWWIPLRWAVKELSGAVALNAVTVHRRARTALIVKLSMKVLSAVIGHAWAITRRACGERASGYH